MTTPTDLKIKEIANILSKKGILFSILKENEHLFISMMYMGGNVAIEQFGGFTWEDIQETAETYQESLEDAVDSLLGLISREEWYWEDYEIYEGEESAKAKERFLNHYLIQHLMDSDENQIPTSELGIAKEVVNFAQSTEERRIFFSSFF